MLTLKKLIEKAYGIPYEEIREILNSEYYVFFSVMRDRFPDFEIDRNNIDISRDGTAFSPKLLRCVYDNRGWKNTKYHMQETPQRCPLIDGCYYHIGFLNHDGSFTYQGIRIFNNGFLDDAGYHLKPFPTHYIKIEKPGDAVYF